MTTFMFEARWKTVRCDHCGAEFAFRVQPEYPTPVHCPCCGHYQASMVSAARRERFGVLLVLGTLSGFIALCVGVLSAEAMAAVPFVGAGVLLVLAGWVRMIGFDPNVDAASRAGTRQACVVLREDYELVRRCAHRRAEPFMSLTWQSPLRLMRTADVH